MSESVGVLWFEFGVLALMIVAAGSQVTKYGDVIAEKTGLGRLFIGVILVATATSLPELFAGIGAVTISDLPDIAIGQVLGSCLFNLLLLVIADYLYGRRALLSRSDQGHMLPVAFGILLLSMVALFLLTPSSLAAWNWYQVGLTSPIIAVIYFVSVKLIFSFEKEKLTGYIDRAAEELQYQHISMSFAWQAYAASAIVVVVAALYLPGVAGSLAAKTSWGTSVFGTVFVALTTSLPELVVVIVAVRMNAADMAIANVLGSNLFNVLVLSIEDVFYSKVLLLNASPVHLVTIASALAMYGLVLAGLIYRVERKTAFRLSWESIGIAILFLLNTVLIFTSGTI